MGHTLRSLGVSNGTQLECDDYAQQLNFKLLLFHTDKLAEGEFEFGDDGTTSGGDAERGDNKKKVLLPWIKSIKEQFGVIFVSRDLELKEFQKVTFFSQY